MNDSKNSSNGLLVLKVPQCVGVRNIEILTEQITPLAESMGLEPMVLDGGADAAVSVDYTSLLTRLCVAVERLVAQGEPPALSEEIAPPALNQRPTGLNSRPTAEDLLRANMERSFHEREHASLGRTIDSLSKADPNG
jgi:hypothetical protein